jgi:Uma2 family endonuclease
MPVSDPNWPLFIPRPPSIDELVTDDGEPLESNRHRLQMTLLIETLEFAWAGRDDYFVGGNMFLYYSALQAKKYDFRGPDVFVVLGTERRDRKAWVIWEEDGKHPDLVIELTSDTTRAVDYNDKKRIYGSVLGIPEYFIYDPDSGALDGFRLDLHQYPYVAVPPALSGRLPAERLGLELGSWQGSYQGFAGSWLRWFRPDGQLLPTPVEAHAEAERQRAAEAARREEAEARLRALEAELAALRRGKPESA